MMQGYSNTKSNTLWKMEVFYFSFLGYLYIHNKMLKELIFPVFYKLMPTLTEQLIMETSQKQQYTSTTDPTEKSIHS